MVRQILTSCQFYGYGVIQLLIEPRRFFMELPGSTTLMKSLGFCLLCSLFFVSANLLTGRYLNPARMGILFFFSSMGMILICAGTSWMITKLGRDKKIGFQLIFSVYAFSSGIVLLVSWMPFCFWITEPWKWWLVFTGFKHSCRFSRQFSLVILAVTASVQFLLLYFLYPGFDRP